MEKGHENFAGTEQELIWDNRLVKRFLEFRNIQDEDRSLIMEIIELGDRYEFAEYHNFFSGYKEKSAEYLEYRLKDINRIIEEGDLPDFQKEKLGTETEFIEKFLELFKKYDYYTAHHLLRLVEDKLGEN